MRVVVLSLVLSLPLAARAATPDPDPWFGADKASHVVAAGAISAAAYSGVAVFTGDRRLRLGLSAAAGFGVGAAKELWDLSGRGDPSWRDLTWDGVGAVVGMLTGYAFDRLWEALQDERPELGQKRAG